jgi:hypothetical protein
LRFDAPATQFSPNHGLAPDDLDGLANLIPYSKTVITRISIQNNHTYFKILIFSSSLNTIASKYPGGNLDHGDREIKMVSHRIGVYSKSFHLEDGVYDILDESSKEAKSSNWFNMVDFGGIKCGVPPEGVYRIRKFHRSPNLPYHFQCNLWVVDFS